MREIRLHPLARIEVKQVGAFYKNITESLGPEFHRRLALAFETISKNPDHWHERERGYRRYNLTRFPYYLPYVILKEEIWIIAVAHNNRKPEYWTGRIRGVPESRQR